MEPRKIILISEHSHNLDKDARLVVRSGVGEKPGAIYRVADGQYVATLEYPFCLEGTFDSISAANEAIGGFDL